MTNSPLGQYAPVTAAVAAVAIIGAYIISALFGNILNIAPDAVGSLKDIALLALGAVFGSAVAVNGTKSSLTAMHKRLDTMGVPPAVVDK